MWKLLVAVILAVCLDTGFVECRKYCQTYHIFQTRDRVDSWTDARRFCQRKGYDLVKIEDEAEDNRLMSYLKTEYTKRRQTGWWIGGKFENGDWHWADGTRMHYTNFPTPDSLRIQGGQVINYAVIFKRSPFGSYVWGYVSPFETTRMGIICETTRC